MSKIKFIALGGLDELGKNCYIIEIDGLILVFDAGFKIPEEIKQGNEVAIPLVSYLEENRNRVVGVFLSHGQPDQAGAIPYIINDLNIPVYCSELTRSLVLHHFEKINAVPKCKFNVIFNLQNINFQNFQITVFRTLHSSIENFVYAISTKDGVIWYATDFLFSPTDEFKDYWFLKEIIKFSNNRKTLAVLCDSTNASLPEFTSPKFGYESYLYNMIKDHPDNRIIVSCFEETIFHAVEIINVAKKLNREIFIYGKTLIEHLDYCQKYGVIPSLNTEFGEIENIKFSTNGIVIVSSTIEKLFLKLISIALNNDDYIKLSSSDVFIAAAFAPSSIETQAYTSLSEMAKFNLKILSVPRRNVRSMHPSQEDIKQFLNITKPSYYIPIKGLYKELVSNSKLAIKSNVNPNNVIVADNGEVYTFEDGILNKELKNKVTVDSKFVSGQKIDNVNIDIVTEKVELGKHGIVFIGFVFNKQTKKITSSIDIQMRGVIYLRKNDVTLEEVTKIIKEYFEISSENKLDIQKASHNVKLKLEKYYNRIAEKKPKIIIEIIEE